MEHAKEKRPPTFSRQELARAAEICSADTGANNPEHERCAPTAGAVIVLIHGSGMGEPRGKLPLDEGSHKRNRPHRARLVLPLPPRSKYRLLFVNELPQSLLSSVLTRKRAWGLLMEKSLSLSALQCGYSYKENRIPCGIWGGGREKEQKL